MIPFFKANGLMVGVWLWTFWFIDFDEKENPKDYFFVNHKGELAVSYPSLNSNEKIISGFICPTSEKGVKCMTDFLKEAAKLNPDIFLFDDDFDYATHHGCMGCYCDRHLKLISDKLGYTISREELVKQVTADKPNEVRKAWYELSGKTLEDYAIAVRKAVDSINPEIRFGLCSVWSNWGTDGTTAEKLAGLLAGNTKPFIRSTGAPYWASSSTSKGSLAWGNRLQHIIELNRMEYAWLQDKSIEFVTEGDVCPRPRHKVPASYLEIFDTALRAANVGDGIHKYMLDYTSKVNYETGYLERHIKNQNIYAQIERIFRDKNPQGVRVYEYMDKIATANFSGIDDKNAYIAHNFFSPAARMLSDNSIPTTYEGTGYVGIAFGENARHLEPENMKNGMILDIRAAKILMERGIDVGIERIGENVINNLIYYPEIDDEVVSGYGAKSAFELSLKENAKPILFSKDSDGKLYPDAFHYENNDGQRFLVYAFDTVYICDAGHTNETRWRNYLTQKQLVASIAWLQNRALPAVCMDNPDMYMLCSANETSTAIGIWNIFADEILHPEILLDRNYTSAEFINCEGVLKDNKISLNTINPFSFAFINLVR